MSTMQRFDYKKCPRCNFKIAKSSNICPSCNLNYSKFDSATNNEAKIAIANGEKSRVIYRKGLPKDVSKWKLVLLTIFLGFVGAHLYYVGRYRRAIFNTIFFIIGTTYTILTRVITITSYSLIWELFYILYVVWGAVLFMWIIDIAKVCLNRFKIPVSLPY